ncbi:hypothetical protein GCM10007857_64790 [Bradyrhizobium iriomotense]|uniref:Uncharacterized protein n=2 Tax=Bradyrhizobium iriomotense TaxID=441950 RepID=A0ABQ6B5V7_9BRAD|nr:hypothetical protein GCM10007857_64790 [Bradyrhizobium iriomotense]
MSGAGRMAKRAAIRPFRIAHRLSAAFLLFQPTLVIEIMRITAAAIDVVHPGEASFEFDPLDGRQAIDTFAERIPDFMFGIVGHGVTCLLIPA